MVKLVATFALGANAEKRAGPNPVIGTILVRGKDFGQFHMCVTNVANHALVTMRL